MVLETAFKIISNNNLEKYYTLIVNAVSRLTEKGDCYACGVMGIIYKRGKIVEKNLGKAANYLRLAHTIQLYWADWELFDTLWEMGTSESIVEAISLATSISNTGHPEFQARMGKAYLEGKGVEKNIDKAIELLKPVILNNHPIWAKWKYIDALILAKTSEYDKEAFEYAKSIAPIGREIQVRIGRMYRDGRGVEVDLNSAAEWMRKAADQNLPVSHQELFDILWRINTPESLKEMIARARPLAESGSVPMSGRLGRAYRDGKGVEKDLAESIKWFKKASERDSVWKSECESVVKQFELQS